MSEYHNKLKQTVLFVAKDKYGKSEIEFEFKWYDVLYMIHTFYNQRRNMRLGRKFIDMMDKCVKGADEILLKIVKIDISKVDLKKHGFQDILENLEK